MILWKNFMTWLLVCHRVYIMVELEVSVPYEAVGWL